MTRILSIIVLSIAVSFPVYSEDNTKSKIAPTPEIDAKSFILINSATKEVLAEKGKDKQHPPASLTKMMTAYLAERELDMGTISLDDEVPVSVKAWQTGGSRMFIREGKKVPLDDLLHGIIIQSGNDASIAMAEHIAGSEDAFIEMMNHMASNLGMTNTVFKSATGLPRHGQYSSAHDLARLASHIINDYPKYYPIFSKKHFTYAGIRQPNRNRLLWESLGVDGLKTGYTVKAGYCLVASAKDGNTRLIVVIMGADSPESRFQEARELFRFGFRNYETRVVSNNDLSLDEKRVWYGSQPTVQVEMDTDIVFTKIRRSDNDLQIDVELHEALEAPLDRGQKVGVVTVKKGSRIVGKSRIVTSSSVEKGGLLSRLSDAIERCFISLLRMIGI